MSRWKFSVLLRTPNEDIGQFLSYKLVREMKAEVGQDFHLSSAAIKELNSHFYSDSI